MALGQHIRDLLTRALADGGASAALVAAVDAATNQATNATPTNLTVSNATINNQATFANNANMVFNTTNGSMIGTASNQKIGLWGATPVIQPATAGVLIGLNGNAATAANATNMNSNGNIGSTCMNFNDVVACLKKLGAAPA